MPASLIKIIPEDLWVSILSFLDTKSLVRISIVCKQLYELCNLRVVWKRVFMVSRLPLPSLTIPHNDEDDTFDYQGHLIKATQLHLNLISPSPTPTSRAVYHTPVSSVWLFRSRYLVTLAFTNIVCWDLENGSSGEVVWGASLQDRPLVYHASEMNVKGSQGIVLAYTTSQTLGCSLLYVPLNDNGSSPPRNLPAVETTHGVKAIGLEKSGVVALACLNGLLVLEDVTTHARRSIVLNDASVWLWVDSITLLPDLVTAVVTRHKNRGITIELYEVPLTMQADSILAHASLPHSRVDIKQAQTTTMSSPSYTPPQHLDYDSDSSQSACIYSFHVLAALPSSIDHYRLTITRPSPNVPAELDLLLLGDDQGSRQKNVGRVQGNTVESDTPTTAGQEENDEYDSDSTLNRIAQPSQVLDLQIGALGKRAMAIHIAPHTNDRTIWTYSLNDEEGPLVARKLGFSDDQLHWIETNESGASSTTGIGAAVGACYGTYAVLSNHYSSARRFGLRDHVQTYTANRLKPKEKSLETALQGKNEDRIEYRPTVVEIIDKKLEAKGWNYSGFSGWQLVNLGPLYDTVNNWQWPMTLTRLRSQVDALMTELRRGDGSLWSEIVDSPPDYAVNPELEWDADVRIGDDLCLSEKAFLRERKRKMLGAFSLLLDVPVEELDERDLPILAIAASGGGFRAMCNTAGALRAAETSGILDVTTYIAGISGSCWTLGALYSGISGSYSPKLAAEHLRRRVQSSYIDTATFDMLITKPTNKYLLTGIINKLAAPNGSLSLVDIYGTLLSARLFTPEDVTKLNPLHLSPRHFRVPVDDASLPMPIFTAVSRHLSEAEKLQKTAEKIATANRQTGTFRQEEKVVEREESNWLWYEYSPYEVGCDELGGELPVLFMENTTRPSDSLFDSMDTVMGIGSKSTPHALNKPEVGFSILSGIFASAFCASLQHYYQEVIPVIRQLPGPLYNWITELVTSQKTDIDYVHPVPPNELPNFVRGMAGRLRKGSPDGITDANTIGLMDAGAELNIPYYPLFRRNVDCIISLDASADSQDLWFTRAESYAKKKGLSQWPRGVEWPKELIHSGSETNTVHPSPTTTNGDTGVNRSVAQAAETEAVSQATKEIGVLADEGSPSELRSRDTLRRGSDTPVMPSHAPSSTYVWIGSSSGEDSDTASMVNHFDEEELAARDGIGIIYMPILANEKAVPGMNPQEVSTWLFEMSLEESGKLMDLAEYNFQSGVPKVRIILRAMWLRKMRARQVAEGRERMQRFEHPP
ncbi:hypothetical protein FRB98_008954 [Tulasnella sp. 332]|nr:hypothetical protein FRB98_008954 [Tulasnella sp. 332]